MSKVVKVIVLVVFLAVLGMVGLATVLALLRAPPAGSSADGVTQTAPAPGAGGAALARIRAAGVLTVAMDTGEPPWTGTPPMYFKDAAGEDAGFDVEVARVIGFALGIDRVKVVHAKYADLPATLTDPSQGVDLLISGYAPTTEAGITWSVPYLEFGLCLVVPSDSPVKVTGDLVGKAVGIFDDDAAAAEVNKLVKGYSELVRAQDGYWDQLLNGRFAGFLYDYPYAVAEINRFYAQNPHRKGAFRIAQYNLTSSTYAVGLREADADLKPIIDEALTAWMASGAYTDAVKRHLSSGLVAAAPAAGAKKTVKVQPGDTLSRIAARELGGADRWRDLWAANQDRFPNPHLIEVGDLVVIP